MTKFTVPFFLRDNPQCPVCRIGIPPHAVAIRHRVAFCQACIDCLDPKVIDLIDHDRRDPDGCTAYSTDRGISFYCPPAWYPGHAAAHIARQILSDIGTSGEPGRMDAMDPDNK